MKIRIATQYTNLSVVLDFFIMKTIASHSFLTGRNKVQACLRS